ncbi:MAG TPA: hypothetical protein VGI81_29350 [Tepidisphaeraceae bacterium]|jgi:hypothetical protein
MKTSIIITATSFVLAVAFTVVAEKPDTRARDLAAWAALLALYGVCVGLVSMVLVHFFALDQWIALAISVPLGLPALYFAARMSEA